MSGAGAGLHGRRFNRRGTDTLYLSTSLEAAFHEVRQGRTIVEPHTLVSYRTNCQNIVDLRTEHERKAHSAPVTDLACAWSSIVAGGGKPPSWLIADKPMVDHDGLLAPSFATGAARRRRGQALQSGSLEVDWVLGNESRGLRSARPTAEGSGILADALERGGATISYMEPEPAA